MVALSDDVVVKGVSRKLLAEHHLRPRKSLGQNFLVDRNIRDKIVEAADLKADDIVLEIGPGMGSLTEALARQAGRVIAVEIDGQLIPLLKERLPQVEIIHGDILKLDLQGILPTGKVKVIANLPYYITTPILFHLLEWGHWELIVVMVQLEVAQRLTAAPGTKDYGALTVAVNYRANVDLVCKVPPTVFVPPPKVHSAVVRLHPRREPWGLENEELFFRMVRSAFGQRRKTLVNTLARAPWNPLSKEETAQIITETGISPQIRGEDLAVDEYVALTNNFQAKLDSKGEE
ncbi:MAG: 16S rRNA (adenine(1518)-N(6)/adenine(1519)-N(6))-dimethyltransferase RsmA [Limnochordia bacterium]